MKHFVFSVTLYNIYIYLQCIPRFHSMLILLNVTHGAFNTGMLIRNSVLNRVFGPQGVTPDICLLVHFHTESQPLNWSGGFK